MKISFRTADYWKKRAVARLSGKAQVHFLHIRKAAGSSIKAALAENQMTPRAVVYLHPHRIRLSDISLGHQFMFVVRDPVERFVSGFLSRHRKGAPLNNVPWTSGEANAFAEFPTPESLALSLNPSAPSHGAAVTAMAAISHLRDHQWSWFGTKKEFESRLGDVFWIGRQETLSSDFEWLRKKLELPEHIRLPVDRRTAHATAPKSKSAAALSHEACALVESWYSEDYKLLEFCQSWRNAHGL